MRAKEFITESAGVRLKDLATVKTNFPDADFWIQRKGSEKSVGTPTKEFSPENIGIKVTATDVLDAKYLYYMMQHIHNTGYWRQFASGALKLVNLPLQHVANLPLGMNESLDEAFPSWAKKGALAAGGAAALAAGGLTMHNKQQQQFEPVTRVELPAAQTTQTSQQAHPVHQDPTKILAHTMWGEARDQGVPGMIAIGNVIKNRANDEAHERRFGKGIVGVATKPKQFSCWNHNDPNFKYAQEMEHLDKIIKSRKATGGQDFNTWLKQLENTGKYLDYKLWDKSYELAKKILSGHAPDPTHGAVFYHTKDIHPYWAKGTKKLATIGKHIFYAMPKDIKESELDEYKVDNENGLGSVPYNANVDYMGLRVLMKPSMFLKLAHRLDNPTSVDHIAGHIEQGGALGSPFLTIDIPREWEDGDFSKDARVSGHEGRNRMMAIQKVEGDEPVEVHLFPRGGMRARHLTPDIIKHLQHSIFGQDNNYVTGNLFSLFQK